MFGGKKDDKDDILPVHHGPSRPENMAETRTQIGTGTVIKGDVAVAGDITIFGSVEGSLTASGIVEIGKGGLVKAGVRGKDVRVVGRVEGKITSGTRVQLLAGGHVHGDIHSQSLKIEEGAIFQGNCVMTENPLPEEKPTVVPMPSDASHLKVANRQN